MFGLVVDGYFIIIKIYLDLAYQVEINIKISNIHNAIIVIMT
jgi:hypothetical protein